MKHEEIINKIQKVFDSCENREQIHFAEKWCDLFIDRIFPDDNTDDWFSIFCIIKNLVYKYESIK